LSQFEIFINKIEAKGYLTFCSNDSELQNIVNVNSAISTEGYSLPVHEIVDGKTFIEYHGESIPLEIFGEHNLMNMMGALNICKQLDVSELDFLKSISSFKGASRRLEKIYEREGLQVFKDFAHSPSKVRATVKAVKAQFSNYNIIAALELHTFSSLNKDFLTEYENSIDGVDTAIVYFDPKAIAHKKLESLSKNLVFDCFANKDLKVLSSSKDLCEMIQDKVSHNTIVLLMSSGNFGGLDIEEFAKTL
jgi:UDP-N-acetylmuramate: L-alanyl-gamma-D-glutamyl-meso-diaminopimelate ligase